MLSVLPLLAPPTSGTRSGLPYAMPPGGGVGEVPPSTTGADPVPPMPQKAPPPEPICCDEVVSPAAPPPEQLLRAQIPPRAAVEGPGAPPQYQWLVALWVAVIVPSISTFPSAA